MEGEKSERSPIAVIIAVNSQVYNAFYYARNVLAGLSQAWNMEYSSSFAGIS